MRQGTFGIRDHAVPRIPVGLQLLDQPAEARDQLDTSVAELGERVDLTAQALRDFATAFRERSGDPG